MAIKIEYEPRYWKSSRRDDPVVRFDRESAFVVYDDDYRIAATQTYEEAHTVGIQYLVDLMEVRREHPELFEDDEVEANEGAD